VAFPALLDRLIELAIDRHKSKRPRGLRDEGCVGRRCSVGFHRARAGAIALHVLPRGGSHPDRRPHGRRSVARCGVDGALRDIEGLRNRAALSYARQDAVGRRVSLYRRHTRRAARLGNAHRARFGDFPRQRFEVFLNPSGDGRNYFEFEINALNTGWDLSCPSRIAKAARPTTVGKFPGSKPRYGWMGR